ncbi:MAG: hypothetical protein HQL87_09160, partial [Magnetococcales bacterium]|nr:hypothetical protein [Magnetococcales bacterium]
MIDHCPTKPSKSPKDDHGERPGSVEVKRGNNARAHTRADFFAGRKKSFGQIHVDAIFEEIAKRLLTVDSKPTQRATPKDCQFLSEQEFEGVVLTVDKDNRTFWARLTDCTADMPDEEAEFSFDKVPSQDQKRIAPGALFSWNIGRTCQDRRKRLVSMIRFEDSPRYFQLSAEAIARSAERAANLASLIKESNDYWCTAEIRNPPSDRKGFALVGPTERFRHRLVKIRDERRDFFP